VQAYGDGCDGILLASIDLGLAYLVVQVYQSLRRLTADPAFPRHRPERLRVKQGATFVSSQLGDL
jgi:hypothetical protein